MGLLFGGGINTIIVLQDITFIFHLGAKMTLETNNETYNEALYKKALQAVRDLFADTSVSQIQTIANLWALEHEVRTTTVD
jgi:hypothetical protein